MGNYALDFGGTDEYVDVGTMGNFGQNLGSGFSISFWIKTTTSAQTAVCGIFNVGGGTGFYIGLNEATGGGADENKIRFYGRDDDVNELDFGTTNDETWRDGAWHHIVITANMPGNAGTIYVDGASKAISYTTQNTPDNFVNFAHNFALAARNVFGTPDKYSIATLDDIAIWNEILSANDASDLYNAGAGFYFTITTDWPTDGGSMGTNLIALWHLDEGTGTAPQDSGVNAYHGTMHNMESGDWVAGKVIKSVVGYSQGLIL